MKLRNKFAIRFAPLVVLVILLGALGLKAFFLFNQTIGRLKHNIEPGAFAMLELKEVLSSLETAITAHHLDKEKLEQQIARLKVLIDTHLVHEEHSEDQAKTTAHDISHRAQRVIDYARYLTKLTDTGWQKQEDIKDVLAAVRQEQLDLSTILDQHLLLHLQDLAATERNISAKYGLGVFVIWCGAAFGVLTMCYWVYYVAKTVLTPIRVLREGAHHFGRGALDYDLVLPTDDEFEELAAEFKAMAANLAESRSRLDAKVLARTRELSLANAELEKEISDRRAAEAEQQKAQDRVHVLTLELLKVQENERKRIALDLHDNVAQELSALKMQSETLFWDKNGDTSVLQERMTEWAKVLKRCIGTVRELSYDLRPPNLEQMGLASALADYCREFSRKNRIAVDFVAAGMERLAPVIAYEMAINMYRLVQEALNNIKKHAGASVATVRLVAAGPKLVLRIEDNGHGCDLADVREKACNEKRLGLLGMEERVRLLAGTIAFSSRPGEGMRIFVEIPWEKEHVESRQNTHS